MGSNELFVFFDLGETLVDLTDLVACVAQRLRTECPAANVANEVAAAWIRSTSSALPREEGARFVSEIQVATTVLRDLVEARGVRIDTDRAEEILRLAWDDFEHRVRFCPGVSTAWLADLRRHATALGIVTDGDNVNVERLVHHLGLSEHFDVIVTSESVRAYKPNPRIYRAALMRLGAEAGDSLFVSDAPLDLRGAAALGMRTALLPRSLVSGRTELPPGALRLDGPQELTELLREFSSSGRLGPSTRP